MFHCRLFLTILFFFLGFQESIVAQSATLSGIVVSDNGEPIENATVYLNQTTWDITDQQGKFTLKNLPNNSTTLVVNSLGYHEKLVQIEINNSDTQQLTITLYATVYEEKEVLITASRTEKFLEDVSVPVAIVNQEEIKTSGNLRLSEVLDEQIGMNIVSNHGTGIQVQGFDPDYTLILIDNQPIIGRTAGTLDLTRLAVGNVEQIEIVKGPSSALWGSNALAGVINIITEKANNPVSWNLNTRYGSHSTYDASSNFSFKNEKFSGRFFGNYNRSNGYDLNKATLAPTIPEYDNYTFSGEAGYKFNKNFSISLSSRYYKEDQGYKDEITTSNKSNILLGSEFQEDYSVSPSAKFLINDKQLFEASAFLSGFESESNLNFETDGNSYFHDSFSQTLNKFELQSSTFWADNHTTIAGIGMNRENLKANIYADVPYFDSYFGFGQHEWKMSDQFSFTSGFRFDAHSEYSSQLSPKFSALYKFKNKLHIRGSLGGGFKAPDFRQLFLNFSNPLAGYSVFGSSTIVEGIERLQNDGQIEELYINPQSLTEIKAEHSFAYNLGFDLFLTNDIILKINGFRNNVTDLIETQRIALKKNGQSVFSYINLNKIYTQGIESELRFTPSGIKGLRLSLGYQYLDAQREITRTFDEVQNGEVISVTKKEFIPLYNRSKHTANAKLFYAIDKIGLDASVRYRYRGKFWFNDNNVNNKAESNEFAEGHNIINASIGKNINKSFRLQIGANNITNYTNEVLLPSNPGITFYTQLNINIY